MSTIFQRKRNGKLSYYYYEVKLSDGSSKRISLETKDKKEAQRLQKKYDLNFETYSNRNNIYKNVTLEEAYNIYLSEKELTIKPKSFERYLQIKNVILNFFYNLNVKHIEDLQKVHLNQFIQKRQSENISSKTITEELRTIKAVLQNAYENEMISEIPIRKFPKLKIIAKEPEKIGYYSLEEIQAMKEYFKENIPEFYDFFCGYIYTGTRKTELTSLIAEDIDFEQNIIKIRSKKTESNMSNMFRYIEIHPELMDIIQKRIKESPFKLFSTEGKSVNWEKRCMLKACQDLNIQYKRLHGLRHTFISNMLNNGVPLRAVMSMVGHNNTQTTMRYSHISQDELKGKINKLGY